MSQFKTEVVWTSTEERWWVYWEKDAEDGVASREETGKDKRGFLDVVKEDMAEVEVMEKDTVDRNNWRRKIRCGEPWWEKPKETEEWSNLIIKINHGTIQNSMFHRVAAATVSDPSPWWCINLTNGIGWHNVWCFMEHDWTSSKILNHT